MDAKRLLHRLLEKSCGFMHKSRRLSVEAVLLGVLRCESLVGAHVGRSMEGLAKRKHKIKRVDRLYGNTDLQLESTQVYEGLSKFVLPYLSAAGALIVDLCYLKEERGVVHMSAALSSQGHAIPFYEEVVSGQGIAKARKHFIKVLASMLPNDKEVILVLDAGFYEPWLNDIEAAGLYYVTRIRKGRAIYLDNREDWLPAHDLFSKVTTKAKDWGEALLTKEHKRACRIITKKNKPKGKQKITTTRRTRDNHKVSKAHSRAGREPWVLATNLPTRYEANRIVALYQKRMQIELMFRDHKSQRYGLSGSLLVSRDLGRWKVIMLLSAIIKILYWLVGSIAHAAGKQRDFQANSTYHKKVFSNCFLGKLIIKYEPGWVRQQPCLPLIQNFLAKNKIQGDILCLK